MGLVHPGSVIRNLQASDHRQTPLARAISECGRISKTLHILSILDDETKRRSLLIQLNRHEGRNKLARTVFHARKGEVRLQPAYVLCEAVSESFRGLFASGHQLLL